MWLRYLQSWLIIALFFFYITKRTFNSDLIATRSLQMALAVVFLLTPMPQLEPTSVKLHQIGTFWRTLNRLSYRAAASFWCFVILALFHSRMLLSCHLVTFRWNADSLKKRSNCQDSHEPKFSQKFMPAIMKMGTKNVAFWWSTAFKSTVSLARKR